MRLKFSLPACLLLALIAGVAVPVSLRANTACDNTSWSGSFGLTASGYVYTDASYYFPSYVSLTGRLSADGAGALTGAETMNFDGTPYRISLTGSYSVNSDCTGSITLNLADASSGASYGSQHFDFVIVDDGKELDVTETDGGYIVTGALKKQVTTATATTPGGGSVQ